MSAWQHSREQTVSNFRVTVLKVSYSHLNSLDFSYKVSSGPGAHKILGPAQSYKSLQNVPPGANASLT